MPEREEIVSHLLSLPTVPSDVVPKEDQKWEENEKGGRFKVIKEKIFPNPAYGVGPMEYYWLYISGYKYRVDRDQTIGSFVSLFGEPDAMMNDPNNPKVKMFAWEVSRVTKMLHRYK